MSCKICTQSYSRVLPSFKFQCRHTFCCECVRILLVNALQTKKTVFKCPEVECKHEVTEAEYEQFIDSSEMRSLFEDAKQHSFLQSIPLFNCVCGLVCEIEREQKIIFCPTCREQKCTTCAQKPHSGGCIKVDPSLLELVKDGKMKPCPGCKSLIEKKRGCDHMTCTNCKREFNWRTLEMFDPRTVPDVPLPPDQISPRRDPPQRVENISPRRDPPPHERISPVMAVPPPIPPRKPIPPPRPPTEFKLPPPVRQFTAEQKKTIEYARRCVKSIPDSGDMLLMETTKFIALCNLARIEYNTFALRCQLVSQLRSIKERCMAMLLNENISLFE